MTQPIFRLVENTFYLEDNFESSEDYRATKLILKSLAKYRLCHFRSDFANSNKAKASARLS